MQVTFSQEHDRVTLTASLDSDDRTEFGKASMARNEVTFEMPIQYSVRSPHPDLLALAALAAFSPWIGKRLVLPFSVSNHFSEVAANSLKLDISNTTSWVAPRETHPNARPGLSFSAGVDSLACLEIMPEDTVPIFSHRSAPATGEQTRYKDDAPLYAIDQMNAAGRTAYRVKSDLEWLRQPVGFGVDPSPAVPLILLADAFSLDAIAFGTIAEAAYRTGTEHFIDYANRTVFKKWRDIFRAAGLDYFNCVAPLSEFCTTQITRNSKFGNLAQSCVRGKPGEPCGNCVKCFRKSLIEASFSGDWPAPEKTSQMMASREIKNYLSGAPIRLEIILAATLSDYHGSDPLLNELRTRVQAEAVDVSFTGAWYGPGIDAMVPEKYRASTIAAINRHIPQMTPEQENKFESFDIRPRIAALEERGIIDHFKNALEKNQDRAAHK